MTVDTLLIGCGRLGAAIGLELAAAGHEVAAIRRRADLVPPPLVAIGADLTVDAPVLPPMNLDLLVVALTARPRTEESYRATYVDGMARALDALDAAGQRPRRAVLVSSTAVFGDVPPEVLTDERVLAAPQDGPARMLLEAEELFSARVPGGIVLRLSGLYDGDSTRLVDQVRAGGPTDPHRWTNRIHRDDAVAAVVHLLSVRQPPKELYVGTDDEPAQSGEVAAHLARQLGLPPPPPADVALGTGRRLSNALLRSSGWVPAHPSFRDGYTDPR